MAHLTSFPSHTVRESRRAKHVLFRLRPLSGLEIVVPEGFDRTLLPPILERRRQWVEQAFRRMGMDPEAGPPKLVLPDELVFRAAGRVQGVRYSDRPGERARIRENGGDLVVYGPVEDPAECFRVLKEHVRKQARLFLLPRLDELAHEHGFSYSGASVRFQKSRWGSCSAKQHISLNGRLIFLPQELCGHVLIHELCHTVHLNHSKRFKDLELSRNPGRDALDRELRDVRQYIPVWLAE